MADRLSFLFAVASRPANAAGGSTDVQQVELALFPLPASSNSAGMVNGLGVLPKPYLRAPGSMTVAALRSWLTDRLAGKKVDAYRLNLQLECAGKQLDLALVLQQVFQTIWRPQCEGADAGSIPASGPETATAAASSGHRDLVNHGSNTVMLVYYSKGEDIE